jgi:hypothetical protein
VTYSIKIFDTQGSVIGELPTATPQDIMKYINKGFIVVDINTNKSLTMEDVAETVGVSDGLIDIG